MALSMQLLPIGMEIEVYGCQLESGFREWSAEHFLQTYMPQFFAYK